MFGLNIFHFRLVLKVDPYGEQVGIFQMGHNAKILTIFVLMENAKNLLVIPETETLINWTRQNVKNLAKSGRTEHGQIGKNCQVVSNPVWFQARHPLSHKYLTSFS